MFSRGRRVALASASDIGYLGAVHYLKLYRGILAQFIKLSSMRSISRMHQCIHKKVRNFLGGLTFNIF